jgi:hypothetical protein
MRLYQEAKWMGSWDPLGLDLRRDVVDWGGVPVAERDILLRRSRQDHRPTGGVRLSTTPAIVGCSTH